MPIINTNLPALSAQQSFGLIQSSLAQSIETLSSGLRINRAADNAAGLAISAQLTSQLNGTQQAAQNVQDTASMVQTADGALNTVQDVLQRMNQLAIQASDGALSPTDRNAIQIEVNQLGNSLNSIAGSTQFNGQSLLSGNLSVQIGSGTIASSNANLNVTSVNLSGAAPNSTYTFTVCTANSTATLAGSNGVTQTINVAAMGADQTQALSFNAVGVDLQVQSGSAALSATGVLNALASGSSPVTTNPTAGAITVQSSPNAGGAQTAINFAAVSTASLGLTSNNLNVGSAQGAQNMISAVGSAMVAVDNQRATLGSLQNHLDSTFNNLNISAVNTASSRSSILDQNIAAATVGLAINQIRSQSSIAMLAQSNIDQQSTLKLLGG